MCVSYEALDNGQTQNRIALNFQPRCNTLHSKPRYAALCGVCLIASKYVVCNILDVRWTAHCDKIQVKYYHIPNHLLWGPHM
jgi:hypothetical protein